MSVCKQLAQLGHYAVVPNKNLWIASPLPYQSGHRDTNLFTEHGMKVIARKDDFSKVTN